jgi:hypothetical protein
MKKSLAASIGCLVCGVALLLAILIITAGPPDIGAPGVWFDSPAYTVTVAGGG